jgi:molybdate transport system substrate-binding protein
VRRLALVVVLAGLLALPAAAGVASRITVYAAASLTEVFPKIDAAQRYSFAGSDQLAFQVQQGAPADVFAGASPKYPDRLYAQGVLLKPVVFATNTLILLVPASNPAHIRSVVDLKRRGIKLVIGQKGVPIGDYTRTVLRNLGLSSVLSNVVSQETDVKSIVGKVALGQADAGFVYVTDARSVAGKTRMVRLPARAQPTVRYEIGVVKESPNRAAAQAFVREVLAAKGRAALAAAGFGLPPKPKPKPRRNP